MKPKICLSHSGVHEVRVSSFVPVPSAGGNENMLTCCQVSDLCPADTELSECDRRNGDSGSEK